MLRPVATLALLAPATAAALSFNIPNGAPQAYLRVGATGATESTVSFAVTAANAGAGPIDGTVVASAGSFAAETSNFPACPANHVRIVARGRWWLSNLVTGTLTVNSSGGMNSGGNTIPFSKISWISDSASDIPSGSFSGAAAQVLDSFPNSQEIGACHRFRFANDTIYPPGTYVGTVTYTLALP